MDLATAAKRRKRKKKKARCTPAKRKPHAKKKAKRSAVEAEARAAARKKRRRKRRPVCKPKKRRPKPGGTHPAATRPATPPAPGPAGPVPPAPPAPTTIIKSPIAVYTGPFGSAQAERLLWRAGFGPRPGQAAELAKLGLEQAVLSLTRPAGTAPMDGPAPLDEGEPLAP